MKPLAAAAVLFVGGLVYGTSFAWARPAPQHEHSQAPKAAQTAQLADFDFVLLGLIAEYLEDHRVMSRLAEQKVENPQLKATAAQMAQAQRSAIERVDQLRARLYPNAPKREPMSDMNMSGRASTGGQGASGSSGGGPQKGGPQKGGMGDRMDMMAQLEKLNGAEFDQAFATTMIRFHEMEAPIIEQGIRGAKDEEVRDLAKQSLATGKKDSEDLRKFAGTPAQLAQRPAEQGVERMERSDRVVKVIDKLRLKPGDIVADIGSGSGTFSIPMAKAIAPNGILYAVDIDQKMLDDVAARAKREGVTNLRTVLAEHDDPRLPVKDVDVAFYHHVLHLIEHRQVHVNATAKYLEPDGRIVVIEPNHEMPASLMSLSQLDVDNWMAAIGFYPVDKPAVFDDSFFAVYHRPHGGSVRVKKRDRTLD